MNDITQQAIFSYFPVYIWPKKKFHHYIENKIRKKNINYVKHYKYNVHLI